MLIYTKKKLLKKIKKKQKKITNQKNVNLYKKKLLKRI